MTIELRNVSKSDLPVLFEQQNDAEAHEMVGITSHAPDDNVAFFKKWEKILSDPEVNTMVILSGGRIAGNIHCYFAPWSKKWEVGYWLGREFWGLGIATEALKKFLEIEERRPIHATASTHNKASVAILEKCGFEIIRKTKVTVPRTGKDVEEYSFRLEQ